MRELVEQYKRIQGMKESLYHVRQDMPGLVTEEAIQLINDQLNAKLDSLAHQITNLIQGNPPDDIPSPVFQPHPLWAVIPADAEDDVWRKHLGPRKQVSYQLFLTKQHAEEYSSQLRKSKVVPVWGE
jgi:hypothetical protein